MKRVLLLCVLAGCEHGQSPGDAVSPGGDGSLPGSCGTVGSGTVSGSVGGVEVNPVVRASHIVVGSEGIAIVLDEVGGACNEPAATGDHLVLIMCDTFVGEHPIADPQTFACPAAGSAALIEQNGGADFANSTAGSVTITSSDTTCTSGTFSIDLVPDVGSPGTMTGSFAAVVCP